MQSPAADNQQQWQPPPRPEWVQRINEEGYCMNISGVVPLDEKSLLDAAMRATGLSDFGAEDWREPFRILTKAFEEEAGLNLMGRLRTRSEVLRLLEARLRIEDTYKHHPEIEEEQVTQPIIVVGQGRSGTSFLINMLAANPDNGVLRHWEVMFPCPPPEKATYNTDPRIEKADKLIKQWVRVTPTLSAMHEFTGEMPQECNEVMSLNFMGSAWASMLGQVPSYEAYMMQQDMEPAIRYHRRVLKLLQWKNPRQHWALKDVKSLDNLQALLKVYPDACFVWPHRDPVRSLASVINLMGTVQWGRSDHPFSGGSFKYFTDPVYSAQRLNAVIDQLTAGVVPARQIYHMHYKDLVGNTMGTLDAMYRHFGIALSSGGRAAMAKYLADNPRDARPPHRFSMGSDADIAKARQAYNRYQDHFNIPNE